ncbi:MAG: Uma2 family endonuclease [Variibacter sp.]|nr:Uma2 family endonuclease [Variibacter sp.]
MNAPALPKARMTVDEFLAWSAGQPEGKRYELIDGAIIAMSPERVQHNLTKLAVARTLQDAVSSAKLPCIVFTDGVAVKIDEYTTREPDASVQCGSVPSFDAMLVEPTVVVEIVSPSSERQDSQAKLVEYFSVAKITHYLVVVPDRAAAVHHRRDVDDGIVTRIAHDGDIVLTPPGLTVRVADMLGPKPMRQGEH